MKVEELVATINADTTAVSLLLSDLQILSHRFPKAVEWLFASDARFAGMLEVKNVRVGNSAFDVITELQPSDMLLGYVHALKIAYMQDFGGTEFLSFGNE